MVGIERDGAGLLLERAGLVIKQDLRLVERQIDGKDPHQTVFVRGYFEDVAHAMIPSVVVVAVLLRTSRSIAAMRTATPISTCS